MKVLKRALLSALFVALGLSSYSAQAQNAGGYNSMNDYTPYGGIYYVPSGTSTASVNTTVFGITASTQTTNFMGPVGINIGTAAPAQTLQVNGGGTYSGAVGIGTTSPKAMLDVNGNVHIGGTAISGTACTPNGTLSNDGSGTTLTCVNGYWQKQSRPTGGQTITCAIGLGEPVGPCSAPDLIGTGSVSQSTTQVYDLCVLNLVAGWAGGFYGQCTITGSPGAVWALTAQNYMGQQVTCKMQCYNF